MTHEMKHEFRSDCPINYALEIFGDKWSLLIVRDMVFEGKNTYNQFLDSREKIATNILSNRLKTLEETGIIQKCHDPSRKTKTKFVYVLSPMGIDLIPLFMEIMLWSDGHGLGSSTAEAFIERARNDKQAFIADLRQKAASGLEPASSS